MGRTGATGTKSLPCTYVTPPTCLVSPSTPKHCRHCASAPVIDPTRHRRRDYAACRLLVWMDVCVQVLSAQAFYNNRLADPKLLGTRLVQHGPITTPHPSLITVPHRQPLLFCSNVDSAKLGACYAPMYILAVLPSPQYCSNTSTSLDCLVADLPIVQQHPTQRRIR